MNFNWYLKSFVYGFLLFLVALVLLFLFSAVTGYEQPIDYPWVGVLMALLMGAFSWWFAHLFGAHSDKHRLGLGLLWAGVVTLVMLLVAIPNQTFEAVFGSWSIYLILIGIFAGPTFDTK